MSDVQAKTGRRGGCQRLNVYRGTHKMLNFKRKEPWNRCFKGDMVDVLQGIW